MCHTSLLRLPNFYLHLWSYRGRCYCCRWQWCLFLSSYFLTSECIEHIESIVWVLRWSSFSCFFLLLPPSPPLSTKASLITSNLTCKLGHCSIYVYITKSWHDRKITFFFCFSHEEKNQYPTSNLLNLISIFYVRKF